MLNLIGYVNAGYTIFAHYMHDEVFGLVVGKHEETYAVWYVSVHDSYSSFYWVFYTEIKECAIETFCNKIKKMEESS